MKDLWFSKDGQLITSDPVLSEVFDVVQRIIAPTDLTALIEGETGTGKEGVARAIHFHSNRSKGPYIAVNCAAIPESLAESTLFGHMKGSFTGATKDQKGYFEQTNGGSIFLDEIGSLSFDNQARMLRVLQQGELLRVGGIKSIKVNVRVIAASNIDLLELVDAGKFRKDLYFRLAAVPVALPPLRAREGDIDLLTRHFLERSRSEFKVEKMTIASETVRIFIEYEWPGNVRELESAMRYVVMMAKGKGQSEIVPAHLPPFLRKSALVRPVASGLSEETSTRQTLLHLLEARSPRKIAELACEVSRDRSTVFRHLKRMAANGQVEIQTERGRDGSIVSLAEAHCSKPMVNTRKIQMA